MYVCTCVCVCVSPCMQDLNVSRCGIGEAGGRALFEPLAANHTLLAIDVSWNALCGDAALALQVRSHAYTAYAPWFTFIYTDSHVLCTS